METVRPLRDLLISMYENNGLVKEGRVKFLLEWCRRTNYQLVNNNISLSL